MENSALVRRFSLVVVCVLAAGCSRSNPGLSISRSDEFPGGVEHSNPGWKITGASNEFVYIPVPLTGHSTCFWNNGQWDDIAVHVDWAVAQMVVLPPGSEMFISMGEPDRDWKFGLWYIDEELLFAKQ